MNVQLKYTPISKAHLKLNWGFFAFNLCRTYTIRSSHFVCRAIHVFFYHHQTCEFIQTTVGPSTNYQTKNCVGRSVGRAYQVKNNSKSTLPTWQKAVSWLWVNCMAHTWHETNYYRSIHDDVSSCTRRAIHKLRIWVIVSMAKELWKMPKWRNG